MFGWTQIIVRTDDYQTNLLCNSKVSRKADINCWCGQFICRYRQSISTNDWAHLLVNSHLSTMITVRNDSLTWCHLCSEVNYQEINFRPLNQRKWKRNAWYEFTLLFHAICNEDIMVMIQSRCLYIHIDFQGSGYDKYGECYTQLFKYQRLLKWLSYNCTRKCKHISENENRITKHLDVSNQPCVIV